MADPAIGELLSSPIGSQQATCPTPQRSTPPLSEFRRVTRSLKRRRNDITTFTGTKKTPSFEFTGGGEGRGTNLDEVAWLVANLKETISQQNDIIQHVKTNLAELQSEQLNLKAQNAELIEEIRCLRTQLGTHAASTPPTQSWAAIAAGRSTTESNLELTRTVNINKQDRERNCLRISTQRKSSAESDDIGFTRYLPSDSANAHIRSALLNSSTTEDVQVAGVGTTKTGYVIRFKDQRSTETARNNTEWLEKLGNGTKLIKPRFGVVVHRTPTEDFRLPENEAQGIQKIMEENDMASKGYNIQEIAWLKSRGKELGRSASLGVWFDTAEAAEWVINNGLLVGQRYIGSVEPYQIKKKRCHRCQAFGHLAWSCKERMRCGFCAGQHDRRDCPPDATASCVDCNGAHPTGDRECRGQTTNNTTQ